MAARDDDNNKKLASLGKMLHSRFGTFAEKVAFVKKRFKNIKRPEALVADALRSAGLLEQKRDK